MNKIILQDITQQKNLDPDAKIGISPPHLSTFLQSVFRTYETKFKIAGDFDYFVKCFLKHKIQYKYFENCLVLMSTGEKVEKLQKLFNL